MYNISKVFKRTVLNPDFEAKHIIAPDRDSHYEATPFSYKTVFYRTPYSYRCCLCAYQHEYFEYLSDKDEIDQQERHIDKDLFEQIVQNIANKRCPHANGVEQKYLATSTVYTYHILAALGSGVAIKKLKRIDLELSGIFRLHPYMNLVLKNSCYISDIMNSMYLLRRELMYPIRSKDDHQIVHWESLSVLEYYARKGNRKVFQHVLISLREECWNCDDMYIIYNIAMKYELKELLHSLEVNGFTFIPIYSAHAAMTRSPNLEDDIKPGRLIGATAAIVYDHPKMLDCILTKLTRQANIFEKEALAFICSALQRVECQKVILKHGFPEQFHLTDMDQQDELFHVLLSFSCHWDEIISTIQQYKNINLPDIRHKLHNNIIVDFSSKCLTMHCCGRSMTPLQFLKLMTLRDDIDMRGLTVAHLDDIFRELVELCLFSNLSNLDDLVEKTASIYLKDYNNTGLEVDRCFDIDIIFKEKHDLPKLGGECIMDANEHFLFSGENFALNFILPLFIECGVPVRKDLKDSILHNEKLTDKLHPAEKDYLTKSMECPRSLRLCCRDSLRRHFKNRQIHQFVSISDIPNRIKDFILLKTALPTLKRTNVKIP